MQNAENSQKLAKHEPRRVLIVFCILHSAFCILPSVTSFDPLTTLPATLNLATPMTRAARYSYYFFFTS